MFHFGGKNSGPVYGALIDIGSGSIGVAVVVSDPEKKLPQLLFARRINMRVSERSTEKTESVRRIKEALLSASLTLSQEGYQALTASAPHAKITKLYVTCTSPWSFTISRNVHYENETPFKITPELMEDLVQSAESEMFTQLDSQSHLSEAGFEVVERATVDVLVNDYRIINPLNVTGTTLSLSHIAGLVPKEILTGVYEVQDKLFPNTELHTHTYMLAMYCVMRDIFPNMHSSCIIDVTGEAIEFGIVENNLLIENTFIPNGSSSFMREVSEKTGKPSSDILTRMRSFGEEGDKLSTELKEYIEMYVEYVVQGLNTILEHRILPSDIIITAHQSYEKLFKFIIEEALRRVKPSTSRIILVDQSIVEQITEGSDGDVYLALGAGFFHKLHGGGEAKGD